MKHGNLRVKCSCKSSYQDKMYGSFMRTATPKNKSRDKFTKRLTEVCCTVCGVSHSKFLEN